MTSYSFTALPPPLGFTVLGEAQDINASGEVVGYYQDNSDDFSGAFHGFAYSGSIFAILDVPGAYDTVVYAINDSGQLAGFYDGPGASGHLGFFASNGIFTTLDAPGAYSTIANAINASGDVAGNYGYFNDGIGTEHGVTSRGFIYSHGSYTTLAAPGAQQTVVYAINDSGQIAGHYDDGSHQHGFIYSDGHYTTLDVPSGRDTLVFAINNSGQVAGVYADQNGVEHAFIYSGGSYTTLNAAGAIHSIAHAINAFGDVAGSYEDGMGQHGFIYSDGSYTTLDVLGVPYTELLAINDSGQIAGHYAAESDYSFYYAFAAAPVQTNHAPVIASDGGGDTASTSVAENATFVTTLAATDVDSGQTLSWSIAGCEDHVLFRILNGNELPSLSTPDFESLPSAGATPGYQITVEVSDGAGGTDTQTLTVTVTDRNDVAATITSGAAASVAENTAAAAVVYDANATDPDTVGTVAFSLTGAAP